jgi:hypothetical protein
MVLMIHTRFHLVSFGKNLVDLQRITESLVKSGNSMLSKLGGCSPQNQKPTPKQPLDQQPISGSLKHLAPLDQTHKDDHHGENQEDMYESPQGVGGHNPQQPQNDQNHGDRVKHIVLLLFLIIPETNIQGTGTHIRLRRINIFLVTKVQKNYLVKSSFRVG